MRAGEDRRAHWERVFTERAPADVSWFEAAPRASLELIDALDVGPGAARTTGRLAASHPSNPPIMSVTPAMPSSRSVAAARLDW